MQYHGLPLSRIVISVDLLQRKAEQAFCLRIYKNTTEELFERMSDIDNIKQPNIPSVGQNLTVVIGLAKIRFVDAGYTFQSLNRNSRQTSDTSGCRKPGCYRMLNMFLLS